MSASGHIFSICDVSLTLNCLKRLPIISKKPLQNNSRKNSPKSYSKLVIRIISLNRHQNSPKNIFFMKKPYQNSPKSWVKNPPKNWQKEGKPLIPEKEETQNTPKTNKKNTKKHKKHQNNTFFHSSSLFFSRSRSCALARSARWTAPRNPAGWCGAVFCVDFWCSFCVFLKKRKETLGFWIHEAFIGVPIGTHLFLMKIDNL